MIVVVGRAGAGGRRAVVVASAIAARGARPEYVAHVAPAEAGDRLLLALAKAGVGHAAVLRSAGRELEPADLELALRYLPDVRVVLLVEASELASTAAAAAAWSGAALVVVTSGAVDAPDLEPSGRVLVVAAPERDPDGAFAGLIAELALRLDAGDELAAAWPAVLERLGVAPISPARQPRAGAAAPAPAPGSARRGSGRRSGRR